MLKVIISGGQGSGKSRLARRIHAFAKTLGLDVEVWTTQREWTDKELEQDRRLTQEKAGD